jgi:hypothetical protein
VASFCGFRRTPGLQFEPQHVDLNKPIDDSVAVMHVLLFWLPLHYNLDNAQTPETLIDAQIWLWIDTLHIHIFTYTQNVIINITEQIRS